MGHGSVTVEGCVAFGFVVAELSFCRETEIHVVHSSGFVKIKKHQQKLCCVWRYIRLDASL